MLRLTLERKKKGWSQHQLAQRTGIHPANISRLENGKVFAYSGWRKRLGMTFRMVGDRLFEEVSEAEAAAELEGVSLDEHVKS